MQLKNVAEDTWTAAGTPVDCVLIGLLPGGLASDLRLGFKADAVISGINAGANMGTDILYSGTAAAARQGSHFGIPSIALSLDGSPPFSFEEPAKWAVSHLNELLALWDSEVFVNVNFPQKEGLPEGIVMTFPSRRVYDDAMDVKDVDGGKIARLLDGGVGSHPQEGSDACEVGQGNISVTRVNNLPVAR
jgi:5'-nucleotidase